jgi:hypothetical protein
MKRRLAALYTLALLWTYTYHEIEKYHLQSLHKAHLIGVIPLAAAMPIVYLPHLIERRGQCNCL